MQTIREQIIVNILASLAEIRTVNGMNTNIGASRFRAVSAIDASAAPCLVLWPLAEEVRKRAGVNDCSMGLRLEGFALFGAINASIVSEQILGDLISHMTAYKESITPAARITKGLAEAVLYTGGGTETYPEPADSVVGCSAVFTIKYQTLVGNPYSQPS